MLRVRLPLYWFGGKTRILSRLHQLLPTTWEHYLEPYFGSGALFFSLPPAKIEVINDIDEALMDLYRVLQDPEQFAQFERLAVVTPWSRQLWKECLECWHEETDLVRRVWRWWVVARQSFSGEWGESWSWTRHRNRAAQFMDTIEHLPIIHARLQNAQIECEDALRVISNHACEVSFIYCDPPYIHATRRGHGYRYEVDDDHHHQLVQLLLETPGKIMLSGYQHEIYLPLEEAGWKRFDFKVYCAAVSKDNGTDPPDEEETKKRQSRVESVWINYEPRDETTNLFEWAEI